jgi:hypothetical protein
MHSLKVAPLPPITPKKCNIHNDCKGLPGSCAHEKRTVQVRKVVSRLRKRTPPSQGLAPGLRSIRTRPPGLTQSPPATVRVTHPSFSCVELRLGSLWQQRVTPCPVIRHSFSKTQGEAFLSWVIAGFEAMRKQVRSRNPSRFPSMKQNKSLSLPGWSVAITPEAS